MGPYQYFKKLIKLIFLAHENLQTPLMEDLPGCHHQNHPRNLLMCLLTFSFHRKLTNYCSIQFQKDFSLCFQDSFSRSQSILDQALKKNSFVLLLKAQDFQRQVVQVSFSQVLEHRKPILFLKVLILVQLALLKLEVFIQMFMALSFQNSCRLLSFPQPIRLALSQLNSRS